MVGFFDKTFGYYHHKFNSGNFSSCTVKLQKYLKLTFRLKFNHDYLESAVWKALSDFNPIDDGGFFLRLLMDSEGEPKRPPPYILDILQWWHLAQLHLTQRRSKKYIDHVTPPLTTSAGISTFSLKISKFCYTKKYRYRLH